MTHALLPGSYDPVTSGHLAVIRRAAALFERVTVLLAVNPDKKYLLTTDARLALVRDAVFGLPNVSVSYTDGYTVDYAAKHDVSVIVKGIRTADDLLYEADMAAKNRTLSLSRHGCSLETLFLPADDPLASISSTDVRNLLASGMTDSLRDYVPNPELLLSYLK